MGAAVGQDCALLEEVCGWINAKATVPVWAKMTPNITDISEVSIESYPFIIIL
jgi:dihydropyrimidine dehydrogenase (NADP+)